MAKKTGFIALATVSLGVNIAASGVVTNVWNNATGDGKWSSVGNWSEGHSPTTAEYAFVSNEVDGAVIDIDVDDLTIKALVIGAPSEAVTNQLWFFGKGITLTEQFTGTSGSSVGRTEIPDKLVPLQVRSRSMVVFDVPVTFSNLTQNTGLWHGSTTGQTLTFLKTVNVPGSTIFYLHGNDAAYVDFKGLFNHPEGLLCGYMYPCSRARFYGPVHVKEICKGVDYNNPSWSFHNPDTQYKLVQISHGTWLHQDAPGVFSTNHVLDVTGHPSINANVGSGCYFNLGDQPRTEIDRLSTAANAATWNILTNSSNAAYCGDGITSMVGRDTRLNGYGHARLTLRGTADDVSGLALYGAYGETYATGVHTPIDLEWDPIGDFTQTLFGRVHCCFGTLTVKRGTLKVAGAASFAYVPRISVLDGGFGATFDLDVTKANALQLVRWIDLQGAKARFRIGENAATPFGADRAIAIVDSGAKFVMPAGASASLMAVVYGGERVANDTYTGGETTASAKHADWIDGDGTITVTAAEKLAYWTGAESGAYEADANWAGGAAPGDGTTAVLLDKATAEPLTVTVSTAIDSFPTDLFVRNRGTAVTTLSLEADVAHEKGDVRIEKGGKVVVKNATYTYTGTFAAKGESPANQLANRRNFRVTDGGEWVTDDGGETLIDYFIGSFLVDGSNSLTGRVAAVNGGYMRYKGYTSYPLHVHPYGLLDVQDGGWVHVPHYSYNHSTTFDLHGGKLNVKDATFGGQTVWGGSIRFGQGEIVFSGTSTNFFDGGAGGQVFSPVAGGEKLHVAMSDTCYNWENGNNDHFYVGGTEGTETVIDYSSTTPGRTLQARIGTGAGKATLNLLGSAEFKTHDYGLRVGYRNGTGTTKAEGFVNVPTGTTLRTGGSASSWAANGGSGIGSLAIGLGTGAAGEPSARRNAYGEIRVSGGLVQTGSDGHSLIGIGWGEGLYVQENGTTKFEVNSCQTVVGLAGGLGHLIVSNGTVSTRKLYVGGCPKSEFAYGDGWESSAGIPFSTRHDAQGKVSVAGGSLTTGNYPVILGADGDGTIEMIGKGGSFTAGSLVLSNDTSSVIRFVAGPDGFSPIDVTGELAVTDGASVEVDLSGYTGSSGSFRLFNFASSSGDLESLPVTLRDANGVVSKPYRLVKRADSLDLKITKGTIIIVM